MSEHQVYEYLAIDEPLSEAQQRQLRKVSTRAEITSTRFWNEYHWGDLKADPRKLLAQYFDLHFYSANWGERVLMMRFPAKGLDHRKLKPYFSGEGATLSKMGRFLVAEFWAEADGPTDDADAELSDFVPLRAQLLDGDRRAAYLGWLAGIDRDANDEDLEPEVPPGLRKLDAPLKALAALLGLDASLLKAASEQSPELHFDLEAATAWLHQQPPAGKEGLLLRAMKDPSVRVGHHLRAAFRASTALPRQRRRSVAELRARATELA